MSGFGYGFGSTNFSSFGNSNLAISPGYFTCSGNNSNPNIDRKPPSSSNDLPKINPKDILQTPSLFDKQKIVLEEYIY